MKTRNRCKGIVVTLTTPLGTFNVRLPKSWKNVRALDVGEAIRDNDRVLAAGGEFLKMSHHWMHESPRVQEYGNAYPVGFYFRNAAARS